MKQIRLNSDISMLDNKLPDLNLLKVFKALSEELNATRAAARLGVSQAAVSASLKRLRAAYGDPLFERTQRGLRPTPRATVIAQQIDAALLLVTETLGGTNGGAAAPWAIVRLGLSDDFEIAFAGQIMALVHAARPDIRLVFRQTNSLMAVEALNNRDIDLAMTAGGFSDSRIRHRALGASHYLAVFDPDVRGHDGALTADEFVEKEHILISYSGLAGVTDDVLAEHGHRRRVRAATTHFAALPFLLAGTDAVATMPSHAARAIAGTSRLAACETPFAFPRYVFGLSWRFDAARDTAIRQVRDIVVSLFASDDLSGKNA
jgi:LysR family transcriptional regulator, mexEF-oprN operon transcriptional activator